MSDEEETTDLRARVRELEQALDEAPSRDRLRELEAGLDRERLNRRAVELANARAEKAEARVAFLEKDWENRHAARVRELVACQVRVAELEGQITRWRRRYPNDVSEEAYQLLLAARPNASDAITREREAE